MKKILVLTFFFGLIMLSELNYTKANYIPTNQDNALINNFSNKINELVITKGENFKTTTLVALNSLITQYSTNEKYVYILKGILGIRNYDCSSQVDISKKECETLVKFYNISNGQDWENKTNRLLSGTSPCTWYGISCFDGHVMGINLVHNNLSNTIYLNGLTYLQELEISLNNLTSLCSDQFYGLIGLQKLSIGNYELKKIYPNQFSGLINLRELNIGGMQLTSLSQDQFKGLVNLEKLDIGVNKLTGLSINQFLGLSNLRYLVLWGNKLTSLCLDQFTGLINLEVLDVSDNKLISICPNTFSELKKLEQLYLNDNSLLLSPSIINVISLPLNGLSCPTNYTETIKEKICELKK